MIGCTVYLLKKNKKKLDCSISFQETDDEELCFNLKYKKKFVEECVGVQWNFKSCFYSSSRLWNVGEV